MRQLSHTDYEKKHHNLTIAVVCDRLQSAANLGSIFRISEAFSVSKLFVHTDNLNFLNQKRFIKTSRHSFKNLDVKNYEDAEVLIETLKSEDFLIVPLEKCDESIGLQDVKFHKKTCFIVGHESTGVNQIFLDKCDLVAHIDMFGDNSSINISQATAIGLYECVRQQA